MNKDNNFEKDEIIERAYDMLKNLTYARNFNSPEEFYVKYSNEVELNNGKVFTYESVDKLSSKNFKAMINNQLRDDLQIDYIPNIGDVYKRIYDEIRRDSNMTKIYNRFAGNKDENVYFFANDYNTCMKVTSKKFEIIHSSDYFFYKNRNMLQQVLPKKTDDSLYDLLKPYVNLGENDYKLFLAYLCHLFIYDTSHMICIISSSHGSGKSTLTRLIRRLVDPTLAENALIPRNINDFINHCANNSVVCFDNSRQLTDDESDIVCAAVTGSTVAKRTLYTTDEETLLFLKNIFIINGIDIVPRKADCIERSLLFELLPIDSKDRKTDSEFWNAFSIDKPYILYAIFKTISKAMKIKQTLDMKGKSYRMQDSFINMCSIALALNFHLEEFQDIFFNNTDKLKKISAEENVFVNAVISFIDSHNGLVSPRTMTSVYKDVAKHYKGHDYPKSSSAFSKKLNLENESLERLGYRFERIEKKDATYITLKRKDKKFRKKLA